MNTYNIKPTAAATAMGQITKRIRSDQKRYLPLSLIITDLEGAA